MRKIKKYNEFISEAKEVGILYHYTNIHLLKSILNTGFFKLEGHSPLTYKKDSKNSNNNMTDFSMERLKDTFRFSMTRNQNFHKGKTWIMADKPEVRFSFNGECLSEKYHIEPHNSVIKYDTSVKKNMAADEKEERIVIKERIINLKDIKKCIISIDIIGKDENIPEILELAEKYGIKINYIK